MVKSSFRPWWGAGATALHYGIYYLLQQVINVNVAYTVGYVLSFVANSMPPPISLSLQFLHGKKLFGMGVAHGVNYLLHIVLLNLFLYVGVPKVWAPLPVFAIAIPVIDISYWLDLYSNIKDSAMKFVIVVLVITKKRYCRKPHFNCRVCSMVCWNGMLSTMG